MPLSRLFLSVVLFWLAGSLSQAQISIQSIGPQTIPSGKTLVVPIAAADTTGSARSYTVAVNNLVVSSSNTGGGINAVIRTGDPHMILGVAYTVGSGSTSVTQTGTMEFQLLPEFAPLATKFISGLTEGGFYSPVTGTNGVTNYIDFHRIQPGFVIQAGDKANNGGGGPGFSYPDEYSNALIFSGSAGQLALAHSGSGVVFGGALITTSTTVVTGTVGGVPVTTSTTIITGTTPTTASQGTDGSEFFITLSSDRSDLDYGYTIFGQMIRGFDTLATVSDSNEVLLTPGTTSPQYPVNITSATITQNNTDAVLLLSATGLCSATITVTASGPGIPATTGSFTATSATDTFDDPPFLEQVPNTTAPDGTDKVTLSGTDLQLDLLRYGYFPILPASGEFTETGTSIYDQQYSIFVSGSAGSAVFTTGTSPTVEIPLVSDTDNTVAAAVDQWNPTPRSPYAPGIDIEQTNPGVESDGGVRVFHIGAGDKAITGSLAAIPAGAKGELTVPASASSPLAVFSSGNSKDTAASFTATVNWGDSTVAAGTIVKDGADRYKLMARHTYSDAGEFPVVVDIADPGGARLHLTGTANVSGSNSGIEITGREISRNGAVLKNVVVATFKDVGPTEKADAYTAEINWGDGAVSAGTVASIPGGEFRVAGSHTYQYPETYTISTSVTGTTGYSGSVWAPAYITHFTAPQVFPPFPQAHLAQVWSVVSTSTDAINVGGTNSGGNPYAGLTTGTDGNLYGTTVNGGADRFGTVYQLTASGSVNTLYSFTGGNDGAYPYAAVVMGTDGNFYGTAEANGGNDDGEIYQITTSGSLTPLYGFTGSTDGGQPYAALVAGTDGLLYGTAFHGGANGEGSLYSISTTGSFNAIASFSGTATGIYPYAPLVQGTDGNFYGTATASGTDGSGTVFSVTSGGAFNFVHSLNGSTEGATPYAALVAGTDGNFYGTAETGGTNGNGTVFQITTSGSLTPLYSFTGGSDGGNPYAALTDGTDGLLYGTTSAGGVYGKGTLFSITTTGSLTTLYSFTGGNDGADPQGTLLSGSAGGFFGTTVNGGAGGFGSIFQFTPPAAFNTVYAFTSGTGLQISLNCSVAIVNSGTLPIYNPTKYPPTFSVYLGSGLLPDPGQAFSQNGTNIFNIPELQPGQSITFQFFQYGSTDNRLKLPVGVPATGLPVTGVVTYTDPVGDYDGSVKTYSPPGVFPP